jgi:hypothetical protein
MEKSRQFEGEFTQKRPGESRRINDRIFSGPRGAIQRYTGGHTTDVARRMYGSAN